MDLNLDTLKREILDYLAQSGFAVFRSQAGGLEGLPMIMWDTEAYPDYQMFLDVAGKAGCKLIMFASREFDTAELDEVTDQLEEAELPRDERREYESRLRDLRAYEGVTCALELAFDHHSRLYVYEARPDWYEEFLNISDEITLATAPEDEDDDGSLGGYFSKN